MTEVIRAHQGKTLSIAATRLREWGPKESMLARYARPTVTALVPSFAADLLPAQQHLTFPRAGGRSTPLMIYRPAKGVLACPPLAVISHGAGGSESGYRYLAEGMTSLGYTAVVMGHAESGFGALRGDVVRAGIKPGVTDMVLDPAAESDRVLDVGATLKWADSQCHARPGSHGWALRHGWSRGGICPARPRAASGRE